MIAEPPKMHKPMPSDNFAERAVCCAVIRDNAEFHESAAIISEADFYSFAMQIVWRAIADMIPRGLEVDPHAVARWIISNRYADEFGGEQQLAGFMVELWDTAASMRGAVTYARIVREKAILRELARAAIATVEAATEPGADPNTVMQEAEKNILGIARRNYSGRIVTAADAVREAMAELDRRAAGKGEQGLDTGWYKLDRLLGGLHRKELIFIAARPGVGKTLTTLNAISHMAGSGKRIFFCTMEQGNTELVFRVFSKMAKINGFKFRRGEFDDTERNAISRVAGEVSAWNLLLDEDGSQTCSRIAANARRLKARCGLDAIFIDYLQLMTPEDKRPPRHEQIGADTRRLKWLAKELDVPVVALCQLNRDVESRGAKAEPRLSDLKGSGDIEQDADCVILLHKPEEDDDQREVDVIKFHVAKQRNGPTGSVIMLHHKKHFEVREMEFSGQGNWGGAN